MSGEYGLASVCSASVRLCGQARANFKCVTTAFEPTVTWTKPQYIILHSSLTLLPPQLSSFSLSLPPSSLDMSHRWFCHALWHMVWVICGDLGKYLLRDKQRWVIMCDNMKDNCVLVLTGRFAIFFFFRNRVSQRLFFSFYCKLENTNTDWKYRRWKHRFNGPSVYSHFQGCSLLIYISVSPSRDTVKNTVDKELFKTYSGNVQLYLASFLSPGLQWM